MSYTAGETILDDHYESFLNGASAGAFGINHVGGTGASEYGLGQTDLLSIAAGQTITASQWNSVWTQMDNIANHTNDSLTSTGQRTAGDAIAIVSALQTDLNTLAASVAAGSPNATAIAESGELQSSVSSTRWAGSHIVEQSITFANNNALRWFFNSGGKMRMKWTRNGNGGGSATDKDDSVTELIAATGNFDLKQTTSSRSGSGETLTTDGSALGVRDLTTSYQTLIKLTQSSGTYTTMYLLVEAKLNAAIGSAVTVIMKFSIVDVDGTDSEYTSGNLNSIDQYENFIGITDFALHTMNPTTAQGLASVSAIASSAVVSNTTA